MRSLLLTIGIIVWASSPCLAQEPKHTPGELQQLIKETGRDTSRVMLLHELAMTYVLKPGADSADMHLAMTQANNGMKLATALRYKRGIGRAYFVYSNICRERDETDRGKAYIQKAVNVLSAPGMPDDLAAACIEKARYINAYSADLPEKIKLHEQAAALYRQAGNKLEEGGTLKDLGDFYHLMERYEEALKVTQEALQLYKQVKFPKLQAVYDQLGMLHSMLGQHDEAIKYGLLALRTAEQQKDSSAMLCTIYNRLGTTHYYIQQLDKAGHYYQAALSLAMRSQDTPAVLTTAANVATVYIQSNNPQAAIALMKELEGTYGRSTRYNVTGISKCLLTAYVRAKEYKKAKPYMEYVLKLTESYAMDDPRRFWAEVFLLEYYVGVGQYQKAISICRNIERSNNEYYRPRDMVTVYNLWHQADSALGNYKDALAHCKKSIEIGDSLNSIQVKNETSAQLVQFETEKKEKDIQLLTKQGQLQQSLLQQATFTRNVTMGGVLASLFFIGLLFNRYRLKQRSNRQLQLQQQQINEKNASLQHLLTEKEWLLKEIHHRIKNNLQTVMSLLSSQSAYLKDDAAVTAIQDSRHRIHAMSLIHQKLYTTDNVSEIDMPVYIAELVSYMQDSFDAGRRIHFRVDIAPLKLDVAEAIPIGLILNEAITNSLKYAFPSGRPGTISISLTQREGLQYLLTIADDGVGISADAAQRTGSLGMSLMQGLSEDLEGNFEIENDNGTRVKISFMRSWSWN